ncbi:cobalamin biosynthesis protein CobD/CbiB [Planctobacterium marinum]|uniref:Adenosylcobinamide-phosphate synthase n=1 Tax=Planctobacterium marinum TaxID=1631968 RepID=A0AA48HMU0_9ALTE|nr:adenosylcobinamide-phosphate synthase [Planctobacterium marinum]
MDIFADLNPALLSAGILIVALLAEANLRWSDKSHPLTILKIFARALGNKAADPTRSIGQQRIAGIMAIFVLLTPLAILIFTIKWFAEYDWFFDAFFLFVALKFQSVNIKSRQIIQQLKADKRALARNTLSSLVLRETSNLSKAGIVKASMETRILRFHYQYLSVIFWYLLGGGIAALLYRCLYEMSQEWNLKIKQFAAFGRPAAWLMFVLQWLPVRLSTLFFTITLGLSGSWKAVKSLGGQVSSHSLILAVFAGALKCELGGPAFYGIKKIRLPKCGTDTLPGIEDARKLGILMIQHGILLCMLVFLAYTSAWFIFNSAAKSVTG